MKYPFFFYQRLTDNIYLYARSTEEIVSALLFQSSTNVVLCLITWFQLTGVHDHTFPFICIYWNIWSCLVSRFLFGKQSFSVLLPLLLGRKLISPLYNLPQLLDGIHTWFKRDSSKELKCFEMTSRYCMDCRFSKFFYIYPLSVPTHGSLWCLLQGSWRVFLMQPSAYCWYMSGLSLISLAWQCRQ